jgi:hypothetical protein
MGLQPNSFAAAPTDPGPRVLHVIPTALGRGAQVFARALVDQLGGNACGHTLVSLFDGDHGVRVDRALGLPGGAAAARGLRPPALARRWDALFTLMVSARDMRLPRAAALEPTRVH